MDSHLSVIVGDPEILGEALPPGLHEGPAWVGG